MSEKLFIKYHVCANLLSIPISYLSYILINNNIIIIEQYSIRNICISFL